jgi:hypothetical protein
VYEVETVKHFSPVLAGLDLKSEFFDSLYRSDRLGSPVTLLAAPLEVTISAG